MEWNFDKERPIFLQIASKLCDKILNGEYQAGERLAPVRELALDVQVNPNTMQRALAELENRGLLYTERTSGRFITKDVTVVQGLREKRANEICEKFVSDMAKLGLSPEKAAKLIAVKKEETNG